MTKILSYDIDEYMKMVESFHGTAAPGILIGGFMIDLAYQNLCRGALYNVICETAKCLPDAVQLLTPCSIGNQWLRIIDVGRFALSFYNKRTGEGTRVYLDPGKFDLWPEIRGWYLKLKPKSEQDSKALFSEIRDAGSMICSIEVIKVSADYLKKRRNGSIAICPSCHEAYPSSAGAICLACRGGQLPYSSSSVPNYLHRLLG